MKVWVWIAFGLGCVLQWAAPLVQIRSYDRVLAKGELHRFKCMAPDPYDMFRGRYLAVRAMPDTVEIPKEDSFESGHPAFAVLDTDKDGITAVKALARQRPADGAFVSVTVRSAYDGKAYIDWPFDRFYLNENIAPKVDEWFRQNIRSSDSVIAEVRVLDGRAVLVDLKQGGRSFRELLKEMPAD